MTEITFRVPARLVHLMEELCKQFPDMEMVSKICPDSSREAIDGWATAAFGELQQNGTLRPGYYAYIMLAANEGAIPGMPFFYSVQEYIDYLRLLGGSKFENEYVCAMLGNLAGCRFYEGDVVAATLRFSTHEYQGQTFQEILVTEIVKVS